MTPEQIVALAAAGYTKAEIAAMNAKPVTLDSLAADVAKLTALMGQAQIAAIGAAEQKPAPTADEILAGLTAGKEETKHA